MQLELRGRTPSEEDMAEVLIAWRKNASNLASLAESILFDPLLKITVKHTLGVRR